MAQAQKKENLMLHVPAGHSVSAKGEAHGVVSFYAQMPKGCAESAIVILAQKNVVDKPFLVMGYMDPYAFWEESLQGMAKLLIDRELTSKEVKAYVITPSKKSMHKRLIVDHIRYNGGVDVEDSLMGRHVLVHLDKAVIECRPPKKEEFSLCKIGTFERKLQDVHFKNKCREYSHNYPELLLPAFMVNPHPVCEPLRHLGDLETKNFIRVLQLNTPTRSTKTALKAIPTCVN